jgi:hypothetical protein
LIILTGNYNFFNLLTIALCIPVWASPARSDWKFSQWQEYGVCCAYVLWTLHAMFRIQHIGEDQNMHIVLVQDSMWIKNQILLPLVPYGTLLMLAAITFKSSKSIPNLFHGLVCFLVIGIMALPLNQIEPDENLLQPLLGPLYKSYFAPYRMVNGYGLFRRMTGVGSVSSTATGWAGLPPSVVARPEIIMEGMYESDGALFGSTGDLRSMGDTETWEELNLFRWKPGAVELMPIQVAPHQPRLDWQMWFAALGSIHHNPWLVHLIQKLLDGCDPVMDLVGANTTKKLSKIRAKLYHYDFTRTNTTWSQTIPGAEILPNSTLFSMKPSKVWTRKLAGDYLPPVEMNDLIDYLRSQGFKSFCIDPKRPCAHLQMPNMWCPLAATIRRYQIYLLVPIFVVLSIVARITQHKHSGNRTRRTEMVPEKHYKSLLEEKKTQ